MRRIIAPAPVASPPMGLLGALGVVLLGLSRAAGPSATVASERAHRRRVRPGPRPHPDRLGRVRPQRAGPARRPARGSSSGSTPRSRRTWRAARASTTSATSTSSGTTLYVPFEQPDYERGPPGDGPLRRRRRSSSGTRRSWTSTRTRSSRSTATSGHRLFDGPVRRGRAAALRRAGGLAPARAAAARPHADAGPGWRRRLATRSGWRPTTTTTSCTASTSTPARSRSSRPRLPWTARGRASTPRRSRRGDLHATVVQADGAAVGAGPLPITGDRTVAAATPNPSKSGETSWPPALVYFAILLLFVALGAVGTMFWRARTTLRPK